MPYGQTKAEAGANAEAMHIIIEHLQQTIYAKANRRLFDEVMRAQGA